MNFPNSPAVNDLYTLGSKTWKWNGVAWDLQSAGLTSSMVTTALGYTPYNAASLSTDLAPYLTSSAAASTYQTALGYTPLNKAGDTMTGSLNFSGSSLRITGDFTSTTRMYVQTSTTNGNTFFALLPNGTATNSQLQVFGGSDPANAPYGTMTINATALQIQSTATGTGTALPLRFMLSATEAARFSTAANFLIGTTTDNGTDKLQVTGSAYVSGNVGFGTTSVLGNSALNVITGVAVRNNGATTGYFQTYNSNAGADLKTWRWGGDGSGNLIFQTVNDAYSSSTTRLTVDASGNLTAQNNVTAYSDERLKTDWSDLPIDFVERLADVKHGTYTRIDGGQRQIGVSAQSLQGVAPEGVMGEDQLSVAYGNVALASAVELAKRVVRLEKVVADLIGD